VASTPPASPVGTEERELPIAGFKGTPEEIERQWFEQVYRGRGDSMVQLTWRAVLMGAVLGGVLSFTNIYIGLKTGWLFGVAITACICSYIIWTGLYKVGLVRTPMTILENNCMQSTASAAGYGTGSTLISAFAAYIMLNGQSLSTPLTMAWVFFLAVLGVTMAVPMKRQMINVEQLRFPSGIAAAETLKALHSHGAKGVRAAKALSWAGIISAIDRFVVEGLHLISLKLESLEVGNWLPSWNKSVLGPAWVGRTVSFNWDSILVAAGMLTGMHVGWSMLLGGTLCWAVYVPILQGQGILSTTGGFKDFISWTLWGGVTCMVTNALLMFALQWRTALRAFAGLGKMFSFRTAPADEMEAIETPGSWFLAGQVVSLIALSWLAYATFGMPIWQSALAVVMSFFLALVACRVTGETDATPMGAMGKVTQLTFGLINPGNVNVNLMSANITAGAASSSADLLTDLKSGYLLGAHPRKQFLAQFAGIFVGTVATVLCFKLMVTKPEDLATERFPAPSALQWKAVAELMSQGASLGPVRIWSILIGGSLGLLFPLLSKAMPRCQKYIPSATAFGFAWVFPWNNAFLFFLGGLVAWLWERRKPAQAGEFLYPVASGIIAGGSLMAVALIFWANGPTFFRMLFQH
jgi:putative OPT family oligopeptide transporter